MRRQALVLSLALGSLASPSSARATGTLPSSHSVVIGHRLILNSMTLAEDRQILVRLPEGYETSAERYSVLYVLDGEWHFLSAVSAVQALSECDYVQMHPVPPLIVVGVVNVDRNRDYTPTHAVRQHGMSFPTSGGADQTLDFLQQELIPFVDATYRTHPYRIVSGWSLGGLMAVHALLSRPEVFDAYLAISPSLWWDGGSEIRRVETLAEAGEARSQSLVMTIGSMEEGGLCHDAVREFAKTIEKRPLRDLEFAHLEIPGETHNTTSLEAQYEGLRALFRDWEPPTEIAAEGLPAVDAYYETLSVKYKQPLETPETTLLALVRQSMGETKWGRCFSTAREWIKRYPKSRDARLALAEVYQKAERWDLARMALEDAIEAELRRSDPDTVYLGYIEGALQEMTDTESPR